MTCYGRLGGVLNCESFHGLQNGLLNCLCTLVLFCSYFLFVLYLVLCCILIACGHIFCSLLYLRSGRYSAAIFAIMCIHTSYFGLSPPPGSIAIRRVCLLVGWFVCLCVCAVVRILCAFVNTYQRGHKFECTPINWGLTPVG